MVLLALPQGGIVPDKTSLAMMCTPKIVSWTGGRADERIVFNAPDDPQEVGWVATQPNGLNYSP
ncbi:hypothetical protein [Legionella nagasakiensis]|uniref:hypothetical protein n=1 Tax=Legionella nagasakiensis TaxID=535290 RepID=UPI0010564F67|nr:hypothetical protein [Legionella nagasakiensis]